MPTDEKRLKVKLLLGFGWTVQRIAAALGVTQPTLRRHYSSELRHRDEARDALKAERLALVFKAAAGGNVGAMRELGRLIERDELAGAGEAFERRQAPARRPPPLGKKEQARLDAHSAGEGSEWGDDLVGGVRH